jgi:hypothetical protein
MHWLESNTLQANPLSESIYGDAMTDSIRASVREDGIQSPLVVCKNGLKVISGNTRLRVAKELGITKVPVLFVECELTSEEEQNLVLSHNVAREKTNEMKVREYRCYLEIEKGQAKQRAAEGKKGPVKVPNLALLKCVTLHRFYQFQKALSASASQRQTRTPAVMMTKRGPMRFSPRHEFLRLDTGALRSIKPTTIFRRPRMHCLVLKIIFVLPTTKPTI